MQGVLPREVSEFSWEMLGLGAPGPAGPVEAAGCRPGAG